MTDIHLPDHAVAEIAQADVGRWITNHRVTVQRQWWTDKLTAAGLADTVIGPDITRGDIFRLAAKAVEDPDAAFTLLWNSLAWGSGKRNRNNSKRIASIGQNPTGAGELLMRAAELSRTSPKAAYEILYPSRRGAIGQLGPAFFTKYLYFAGCGDPKHPCTILDVNVARALNTTCGWESLPINGGWRADTYERYCALLNEWMNQHEGIRRLDLIERWLFEEGKHLVPPRKPSSST